MAISKLEDRIPPHRPFKLQNYDFVVGSHMHVSQHLGGVSSRSAENLRLAWAT